MEPVAYRVGMIAAALSDHYDGQVIGIMLTASHNPVEDNGVKLVDPDGNMLSSTWEPIAESLANCPLVQFEAELKKHFGSVTGPCRVAIGRDTRPSGAILFEAVKAGAAKLGAQVINVTHVTTPEFHTAIARLNKGKHTLTAVELEENYITELASSFLHIVSTDNNVILVVDASNGIGAPKVAKLAAKLERSGYKLIVINDGSEGILNSECGADYVKVDNCPPRMKGIQPDGLKHYCSLDGDADRVVYFTFTGTENRFFLIDGDRISALFAKTIIKLIKQTELDDVEVGIVQTAYANGASTNYIKNELGIPVLCTPTGVKYLHEAAHSFDVGVYFEANGHGTVIFKEGLLGRLRLDRSGAAEKLLSLARLANQHVGDALADMLLVEAMLKISELSIEEWTKLYNDLPSSLAKVPVKDRTKIITADADRRITEPATLQMEIDRLVAAVPNGRAFARPSGTEDVVRIFAEAATPEAAIKLTTDISKIIPSYLGL
jgi:phosphoacetylglucosamine mutase